MREGRGRGVYSKAVLCLSTLLCCEPDVHLWAGPGAIRLLQMESACCLSECVCCCFCKCHEVYLQGFLSLLARDALGAPLNWPVKQ